MGAFGPTIIFVMTLATSAILGLIVLARSAHCFLVVFESTAAGMDEVAWPDEPFVDWLTSKENPFFAKSMANRTWSYFLGRGIIDPVDDIRSGNPPSNPELLEALTQDFIKSGFSVRCEFYVFDGSHFTTPEHRRRDRRRSDLHSGRNIKVLDSEV